MASYTGKNTEKGAKPMGQKDITEKVLEDYNDVFADIINGLLFGGEQEIKPEDLENTTVHAQYKAEDDKVHELDNCIVFRDRQALEQQKKDQRTDGNS